MVAFRERVRREVFKGQDAKGAHRTGSGKAAVAILGYAAAACGAYLFDTGLTTGFLLGKPACRASLPPAAQVQVLPCITNPEPQVHSFANRHWCISAHC